MIQYCDLWLYGFWNQRESEKKFIVYGVKKRVLLSTVISQLVLVCLYLFLLFTYSFEQTSFFLVLLFITMFISIFLLQRSIQWLLYDSSTGKVKILSRGLKAPDDIKGTFTMSKKTFIEKSGFCGEAKR
jgi:uncharacterized membrane protein YbhN (UPF0104 family)